MTGSPVPVGPLASATSVSGRNQVPVTTGLPVSLLLGPLAPFLSATAGNCVPAKTGPPAPVPASPPGSATSAKATGFPISIGHAVPIVAILHFIPSPRGSWTLHVRALRFPPGTDRMSLPAASPCPNFGRLVSGGPSVAGPFRYDWDRPIPWPFRPSSAPPMVEIPDYRPPSGHTYYCPPVYAKGASLAYFGGDPHQGQCSFDLRRPERLTIPFGPLLVSRTLYQFLVFIVMISRGRIAQSQSHL